MERDLEKLVLTMTEIWRIIRQSSQGSFEDRKATQLQLHSLRFLHESKNATVTELANYIRISLSSATQLTERLVAAGFVKRVDDIRDRRVIRIKITKKGEREMVNLLKEKTGRMKKVFANVPKEDLKELVRIQMDLLEKLKKKSEII